jgi:hypothetical protein
LKLFPELKLFKMGKRNDTRQREALHGVSRNLNGEIPGFVAASPLAVFDAVFSGNILCAVANIVRKMFVSEMRGQSPDTRRFTFGTENFAEQIG